MAREPLKAVRGIDDALWDETVAAARNLRETHGQFVSRALRRELEALRTPIAGEIQPPSWPERPVLSILDVDAAWRIAQAYAAQRSGRAHGRIPERQLRTLRAVTAEVLAEPRLLAHHSRSSATVPEVAITDGGTLAKSGSSNVRDAPAPKR